MPITFDFSKAKSGVDQATFDAMPEDVKPFYAQGSDKNYALKPEIVPLVDTMLGVVAGLRDERGKVTRLNQENAQRRVVGDAIDSFVSELGLKVEDGKTVADAIRLHVDELRTAVKNGKDLNVNIDAIKADFARKLDLVGKAKDAEIVAMKGSLEKYLIDSQGVAALAAEKGNPVLLMPHVKNATRVVAVEGGYAVRVVDAQGNPRFNATGQEMGIGDLVKEMKADKVFAGAFESEQKGGTGTPTNQRSANPQQRQQMNQVEKSSVQKIGDALAKRGVG